MLLKVEKFDLEEISKLLIEKCRFKGIEFDSGIIFNENRLNDARRFWEVGLKDLVKELPDFDLVIDELKHELRKL
jgi:hypothetical protein